MTAQQARKRAINFKEDMKYYVTKTDAADLDYRLGGLSRAGLECMARSRRWGVGCVHRVGVRFRATRRR